MSENRLPEDSNHDGSRVITSPDELPTKKLTAQLAKEAAAIERIMDIYLELQQIGPVERVHGAVTSLLKDATERQVK